MMESLESLQYAAAPSCSSTTTTSSSPYRNLLASTRATQETPAAAASSVDGPLTLREAILVAHAHSQVHATDPVLVDDGMLQHQDVEQEQTASYPSLLPFAAEPDLCDFLPALLLQRECTALQLLVRENVTAEFLCDNDVPLTFLRSLLEQDVRLPTREPMHSLADALRALRFRFEHAGNRAFFDPLRVSSLRLRNVRKAATAPEYCNMLEMLEASTAASADVAVWDVHSLVRLQWNCADLVVMGVRFEHLYERGMRDVSTFHLVSRAMGITTADWRDSLGMRQEHVDLLERGDK
jgi:hypothetical protein